MLNCYLLIAVQTITENLLLEMDLTLPLGLDMPIGKVFDGNRPLFLC